MNLDQIKKNIKYGDYDILQKLLKTSSVSIAKQKFLRGDKEALEAMIVIQKNRTIFPYLHDEFYELENLEELLSSKADKAYVDQKIQNVSLTPGPQGLKGDKGETGATGATGIAGTNATISGASATVRNTVGTPSVTVTSAGTVSNRSFSFTFSNIKGDKGDSGAQGSVGQTGAQGLKGDKGDIGATGLAGTNATISGVTATVRNTVGTPTVAVTSGGTSSNRSFSFTFSNIKGDKGDTGPQGPPGNSENRTTVQNIYKIDKIIDLEANKTRVLITEKDIVQIEKGKRDGDELILCGYGQGWETRVSIPWMDRSGKVLRDLVFNVDRTMHFWWSEKEACWLDISMNVFYK